MTKETNDKAIVEDMLSLRDISTCAILFEIFVLSWGRERVRLEPGKDPDHGEILIDDKPYLRFSRTASGNYFYQLFEHLPHRMTNCVARHSRNIDQLVRIRLNYPELFLTPDAVTVGAPRDKGTCSCTNGCKSSTCDKL